MSSHAAPPSATGHAFVGRERELAELLERLDAARVGHGSAVLLAGESGIGKTRLTAELSRRAAEGGSLILWGRCWEAEFGAPALWPWSEAIGDLGRQLTPERGLSLPDAYRELAPLLPAAARAEGESPRPTEADPESTRFRLFSAYARLLAEVSPIETGPTLVVVDDLHLADRASFLLLQYLAREVGKMRVLIVATFTTDRGPSPRTVAEALANLQREPDFHRVSLRGLTAADIRLLVESSLEHPGPAAVRSLAATLRRQTNGNPFFVKEMLAHLVEAGGLARLIERSDESEAFSDLGVPSTLREVVTRRLERLSPDTSRVLAVASAFGAEFDLETLEEVAGLEEQQIDRAVQEAEQAGIVAPLPHGERYRFEQAVLRQAIYGGLASRERRRLHRALAGAIERSQGEAHARAAELAYHSLASGDTQSAYRYARLAGQQAEQATAWEDAAGHYDRCLSLLDEGAGPATDEPELLVLLGRCLRNANDPRGAWRRFQRAIASFVAAGEREGMARATLEALRIVAPPERRQELVRRALAFLDGADPRLEAQLLLHRAIWADGGDQDAARRAAELAAEHGFADVEPILAQAEANRILLAGKPDEARRMLQRLHETCAGLGMKGWALNFLISASTIPLFAGRLDEGVSTTRRAIRSARESGNRLREAGLLTWLAGTALARGESERFESLIVEAETANPENFSLDLLRAVHAEVTGDVSRALALMPPPERAGRFPGWLSLIYGARARIRLHAGDTAGARADLAQWTAHRPAYRVEDGRPGYLHALSALDDVVPALADERVVRGLYGELRQWSWAHFSPANASGLDHQRGALALRLGRLDEAETHYREGLEWAERERCLFEAAQCRLGLAETQSKRGETHAALESATLARDLFEASGAGLYLVKAHATIESIAASPRAADGDGQLARPPDGLSAREVEVLRLLAEGLTNQEIARALTISTNTVARHVTHIFNKTSTTNRTEAANYAHRQGLV